MTNENNQDTPLVEFDENRETATTIEQRGNETQAANVSNAQDSSTHNAAISREAAAVSSRGASQNQDDATTEQQRNALYKSMQGKGENVETRDKHEKKLPWQEPEMKDGQSKFFDHPDKQKPPSKKRGGFTAEITGKVSRPSVDHDYERER